MRKWMYGMLVVVLVLSALAGCDTGTPTEVPATAVPATAAPATAVPATAAPSEPLKVGMVSDVGGIDDASFNQNTWDGLQRAADELGIEAKFIESQAQADYEKNITEFAEQDYDMIITVGFLLGDATAKMAAEYPDVNMAIVDNAYDPPIPNVQGIVFNVDEAAFPIGYLAAGWASLKDPADPQVGWIGGMQIPPVEQFIVAYEAGVKYYNTQKGADVKVKGVYVGDFESPDKGKIQGNSLIDEGVDVIFGVGGKTGNGGLTAAKERGKWGVGVDVDQYNTLPNEKDILITSCMKRLDNAVFNVVKSLVDGTFAGGGVYVATAANGGVGLAPYHDFEAEVPAELKAEVEAIQQGIIAGTIKTGWPVGEQALPGVGLKVGMVSDVGGIDDASFNQNTWDGLQRAATELGIEAKFIESQAQADYEKNITEFAEQEYDMIITVGFLLGDATAKMAAEYPDVNMAIVDNAYDPPIANVQGIVFNVDEAAFPIGYLAAGWASLKDPADPQVGWVGGMQIPPVEQFIVAYEAGVKYYNTQKGADVKAKGVYVGDFESPDKGKIQGNSLIDEGVDVIFGVGGKTGNGGLTAAKERGKWGVGVDVDQYFTLPNEKDILITSCMKRLDNAVFNVVSSLVDGTFAGGGVYVATAANGGVGLAPYHDFENEIPADLKAEVEAIQQGIVDGTIKTGWPVVALPGVGMKVGMVSDVGGIDDASFNQNTWDGLQRAADELGIEAKFIESQAQADYEKNITEFAEQEYDMIITVGFLLGDATAKMAAEYPDVNMAIVDNAYDPPIPNVQGIVFNVDEAAFPIGYLAAGWASLKDPADPQVGWIGGMQIPPVEQFIVAYEAGVKYYNTQKGADVKVKGVYVGDFESPDKGKIQGNSLIDEGVDVIFGVGGKTGNGGLTAAKERGKWGVGVDVDQYNTLPNEKDILITSCMKRLDNAVFNVVKSLVDGTFAGGGVYVATATNGGVGLAPYHDFEAEVPAELKAEVDAIVKGIIDGTIKTGWPVQ